MSQRFTYYAMSQYWSKSVHKLTPYTPGEQPQVEGLIKLNTNENPYGPSPKVLEAIQRKTDDSLRKYPDPGAQKLKSAAATFYGLTTNQVFVANSSDEVLAHVFRTFFIQDLPLLFPDITYSFYPVWCQLFDISFKAVPLDDNFAIATNDYRIENGGIIFANPNAPTGLLLSLTKIVEILEYNINSVVVIDEAYIDFGGESAVRLIDQYPNLLVIQTLSKSRSLAGLRVGMACGSSELVEGLERVKNSFHPYALDALALAGATASFEDVSYFNSTCGKVIATREWTNQQLTGLGFEVLPSSANFVLVRHPQIAAEALFEGLRERKIITRYFKQVRIEEYLRISIGTDDDMQSLISAIEEILT